MSSDRSSAGAPPRTGVLRLFWRVHFWAGLITAPIVLFAAGTGLLYVFTPQIEAAVHAALDRVPVGPVVVPLDLQLAQARAAMDGRMPRSVVPGHAPGETTQVFFAAPAAHAEHASGHAPGLPQGRIVYVNPYTAQVVGQLDEMQRFKTWARKLHSSALQGDGWRWPLELAASWMLVMFATGAAMWWPGRGQRRGWRRWHSTVGLSAMGLLAVVLVTGLTWSRHAGENFRWAQEALGQASPKPPKALRTPLADAAVLLPAQTIYETARAALPDAPMQMVLPRQTGEPWRIDTVVRDDPRLRTTLLLDAGSGREIYRSGWDELPLLARATAVGIPFHRAEFGVWNQGVLALAAAAAVFSVVSGGVVWWRRRPRGRVAAPAWPERALRAVPPWLAALCLVLAVALPVFGISLALFVAVEMAASLFKKKLS